ncbi:MAG: hypothetical protein RBS96_05665 [Dehalococcoidales bacterium]|nr:hypothetical protein [Dehalococcoidales bacterium]
MKMMKGMDLNSLSGEGLDKDIPVDKLIDLASKAFEITQEPFYDGMKELFFDNCMIEGFGHASDPVVMEQMLEKEGLSFEFILFQEGVKYFLGESLKKVGEQGKLLQQGRDIQTQKPTQ